MTPIRFNPSRGPVLVLVALVAGPIPKGLAQFGDPFTPPEVSVPFFEHWVLEKPVFPAVLLVVLGCIAALMLRRAGRFKQAMLVIGASLVVAGGLVLAAASVTTERERVAQISRDFIAAVSENDAAAARQIMQPTVSLRMGFGARAEDREALLVQIERLHEEATVRGARVLDARCEIRSPTLARAFVRVRVEGNAGGFPIPPYSWWELNLSRQQGSGALWRVAAVEPLWMTGIDNPAGR